MTPEFLFLLLRILAVATLYVFLGFIGYTLWKDLRQASSTGHDAPQAHLFALDDLEAGSCFDLEPQSELGRTAANTIKLDNETVSAHHARIFFQGGQWWLEDLASRNGTQVNEIKVDEPLVITYGDELRLGTVRLRLERGPSPVEADNPTIEED
jgi:hypothetical protein